MNNFDVMFVAWMYYVTHIHMNTDCIDCIDTVVLIFFTIYYCFHLILLCC